MRVGESISRTPRSRLLLPSGAVPSLPCFQQFSAAAAAVVLQNPCLSRCCLLVCMLISRSGTVSCPSLSLSINSPCHVPSVFSPALRFLCLMSHSYILQGVCLAFISPISAFLEGWRRGLAAAFPYRRLPAPSSSRHCTVRPNSPWCLINPSTAGGISGASLLQHSQQPIPWCSISLLLSGGTQAPASSPKGGNQYGAEGDDTPWVTPSLSHSPSQNAGGTEPQPGRDLICPHLEGQKP